MPDTLTDAWIVVMLLTAAFAAPLLTTVLGVWRGRLTGYVAVATNAVCFALVLLSYWQDPVALDVSWVPSLGLRLHFELDGLAQLFALLATGIGLVVVVYAQAYLPLHLAHAGRSLQEQPRFFGFFLLFMAAMVGLVMAQDAILQFLFWDLTAIASFYLIGYDRDVDESRDSAFMALVVTGVSAVLVLIGVLILRSELGSYQLPELFSAGHGSTAVGIGVALVGVGALAKSAQVPLHFWLPRAMAAPTPVSAYLHSAAMVAAGVFLIRRYYPLVEDYDWLLNALLVIGFVTIAVGAVLSLSRDNLKQVLAYSTVSQYGYVVVMLGLGGHYGVAGATFYVLAHALVKSALFLTAGSVTEATGSKVLSKTGGLGRRLPLLAVGSAMAAAGMVALPLTIGFFKDELFFHAAWEHGRVFGVMAVVSAGLTFAYIGRFWTRLFLGEARGTVQAIPGQLQWPVVALGVATVVFGLWMEPVRVVGERAAIMPGAELPHLALSYHFDVRSANVMALSSWGLGAAVLLSERWWAGFAAGFARLGERIGPERVYFATLARLEGISDSIHRVEVRDLRSRVASILAPAGVLVGLAVILTPNRGAFEIGVIERGDLPMITMMVASAFAAIATMMPRDHLRLVITLSCLGYALAVIYALIGAPDVALVAVLVETMLSVFFICMLLLMPKRILRYETRHRADRFLVLRDLIVAIVAGVMAFFVAWGVLSRPSPSTTLVERYEQLTPEAHGTAIVTVILADFRGFDTLGEITVVLLIMLGVMSLIRKGRLR